MEVPESKETLEDPREMCELKEISGISSRILQGLLGKLAASFEGLPQVSSITPFKEFGSFIIGDGPGGELQRCPTHRLLFQQIILG